MERQCLLREGKKRKDTNRVRIPESDRFLHFPFPTGKALCCHFTWQNVGSDGYPYDRSALHRDKNTWTCATTSIFVPSKKGYF